MDSVEHSLRRDNQRLRDNLADMGNQRDRAISSAAREMKEAKRLRAEIERLTALLEEAGAFIWRTRTDDHAMATHRNDLLARIKEPRNDK